MKKIISMFCCILIVSCCGKHTEVTYIHKDVTIKRIDECSKTTFYYESTTSKNKGKIWAEYSGINDGFSGYLIFEENDKVVLWSGDGYFQEQNIDTSLFKFISYTGNEIRPIIGENVCEIMLSTKYEQENNNIGKSGIKAVYDIDDNEWW